MSIRWQRGWDDAVPFLVVTAPMLTWSLIALARPVSALVLIGVAMALAFALKRLLPPGLEDLALAPPVLVLLAEVTTFPVAIDGLLLASVAGVGLLLWAGAEPALGITLGQQLGPAVVPALAVSVAVAVMFFLPGGSGGQVGVAALVLVAVLGLSAWLYLRSAEDVARPTSTS